MSIARLSRPFSDLWSPYWFSIYINIIYRLFSSPLILSCLAAPGPPSLDSTVLYSPIKSSNNVIAVTALVPPRLSAVHFSSFATIKFYVKILIFNTIVYACRDPSFYSFAFVARATPWVSSLLLTFRSYSSYSPLYSILKWQRNWG